MTQNAQHRHTKLGLTDGEVIDIYQMMLRVRTLDERVWILNRQGKLPIVASCQGHEAGQMGSLLAAKKYGDYFLFPYYRDLALKMMAGVTSKQAMLSYFGKAGDPFSGGRQFPLQGAFLDGQIIQISNVVGPNITQATGYALASKLQGKPTVVFAYFGDGGSSTGDCHEAMNFSGIHSLPIIFICENNKFAISVPQNKQMAINNVSDRASGYGLLGINIDGMDVLEVYDATTQAINNATQGIPVLLELQVERFLPHTSDDDDRRYRDKDLLEAARNRDPLLLLKNYVIESELITDNQIDAIYSNIQSEIDEAMEEAEASPFPNPSSLRDYLFSK